MTGKLLCAFLLCTCWVCAQDAAPKPQSTLPAKTAKPKAKKVYTEDDLRRLPGRVSVIGTPEVNKAEAQPDTASEDEPGDESKEKKRDSEATKPVEPLADCLSASWAKIVSHVAAQQGLQLSPVAWHQRLFGSVVCDRVGSADQLVARIGGDYTDAEATRFRVEVSRNERWPSPELLVEANERGDILILVFGGRPYLLDGIEGKHQVITTGGSAPGTAHTRLIERMRFYDPGSGKSVTFSRDKDRVSDISTSFYVVVSRR